MADLKIEKNTDLIAFGDEIADADIQKMLAYRKTMTARTDVEVLDPSQKNFVLWADDPDNVVTNLPLGNNIIDDNTQSVDHTYSSNKIESRIADFVSKGTSTNNQGYIKLAEPNFYLVWGTHNIGSQTVNGHTSKGQFSFDAPFRLQGVDVGIASLGGDANVVSGDIYMASSTKFGVYIANTKTDNVTANFNLKYMCIVRKA